LKLPDGAEWDIPPGSPPSRGRGLKLIMPVMCKPQEYVAPFTGAWIETQRFRCQPKRPSVAPFTGAWIET